MTKEPFYRMPQGLWKNRSGFKKFRTIWKALGRGIFDELFEMCANQYHTGFIISYEECFKTLAINTGLNSQRKKLTRILDTMASDDIQILDPTFYRMDLLYMPIVYEVCNDYFLSIFKSNKDNRGDMIIKEIESLYKDTEYYETLKVRFDIQKAIENKTSLETEGTSVETGETVIGEIPYETLIKWHGIDFQFNRNCATFKTSHDNFTIEISDTREFILFVLYTMKIDIKHLGHQRYLGTYTLL